MNGQFTIVFADSACCSCGAKITVENDWNIRCSRSGFKLDRESVNLRKEIYSFPCSCCSSGLRHEIHEPVYLGAPR